MATLGTTQRLASMGIADPPNSEDKHMARSMVGSTRP